MFTDEFLKTIVDYHYWGNQLVLEAAARLSTDQLNFQHGHSHESVRRMLLHMLQSELFWLTVAQHDQIDFGVAEVPQAGEYNSVAEINARWQEIEQGLREFISTQTPATLQQEITIRGLIEFPVTCPRWQLLAHLCQHGAHHRGELAAMFAALKVPHNEDVMFFFLAGRVLQTQN